MVSFNVRWEHGHFIDLNTGKRIIPNAKEEYVLTGSGPSSFSTQDAQTKHLGKPKNAADMKDWVTAEWGADNIIHFLPAETVLYFRVGNSKKIAGDESSAYTFTAILLEDLYLHCLKTKTEKEQREDALSWRLIPCQCKLQYCLGGEFTLPEPMPVSTSLSLLFNDTVNLFFSRQRSSACNVFNVFSAQYEYFLFGTGKDKRTTTGPLKDLRREKVRTHFSV